MGHAHARVRRVTIRVPDADATATVVRGVGYRFVCSCGARGSRRDTWKDARTDAREHVLEHTTYVACAADE